MIKVSDITTYLKCPRMCYFTGRGHELIKDISSEYIEHLILKELALTYGSVFDAKDKISNLNQELDRVSSDITVIYSKEMDGIDTNALEKAVANIRSCLEDICCNISNNGDFYAKGSFQVEPLLISEKLGMTGSPGKFIDIDKTHFPSIIKTGKMPENGIWQSDRIQLTAYAMLIEDKFHSPVEHGFVEFARLGKVRQVRIKRNERRKVIQIRDRLRKILNGFMPERQNDAPCMHCGFEEICDVRSTLASRFF
jgi:CRISPR-associated exonuclease Cas4